MPHAVTVTASTAAAVTGERQQEQRITRGLRAGTASHTSSFQFLQLALTFRVILPQLVFGKVVHDACQRRGVRAGSQSVTAVKGKQGERERAAALPQSLSRSKLRSCSRAFEQLDRSRRDSVFAVAVAATRTRPGVGAGRDRPMRAPGALVLQTATRRVGSGDRTTRWTKVGEDCGSGSGEGMSRKQRGYCCERQRQ